MNNSRLPGQREIKEVAEELKTACKNHGKIRATPLSRELVRYGSRAVPIFAELLSQNNSLSETIGTWGLGEIGDDAAVDVLIKHYADVEAKRKFGSFQAVENLAKLNNAKAKDFLRKLLTRDDGVEIHVAVAWLTHNPTDKHVQDTLIRSVTKHRKIRLLRRLPWLLQTRKDDVVAAALAVLADPRLSDWNWDDEIWTAADILVDTNYADADVALINAFRLQKGDLARSGIVRSLSRVKSRKADDFLDEISGATNRTVSPFIKDTVRQSRSKHDDDTKNAP